MLKRATQFIIVVVDPRDWVVEIARSISCWNPDSQPPRIMLRPRHSFQAACVQQHKTV